MTFTPDRLEKLINRLNKPAERTKEVLKAKLFKSVERFKTEARKEKSDTKKTLLLKRLGKIKADIKLLKELSVDTIIRYALSTDKNLMAVAANKRMPNDVRMKARILSHKPLSTHISQLRKSQQPHSDSSDDSDQEDEEVEDSKNESCAKLDKITLNNQLVLMRKDTRRAIVHTINKWTRAIKKLRSSKAVGDKKTMLEAKAEKLVKKIKYIKECEVDEISKFALSNAQPAQKILSDAKMPLKSQAIATVCINKFIQSKVEEFRTNFPGSMKTVLALMKQKKKKRRKLNLQMEEKSKIATLKRKSTDSESENLDSENEDASKDEDSSGDEDPSENDDYVNNSNNEESANEESEEESSDEEEKLQRESSDVESDGESLDECKIDFVTKTQDPKKSLTGGKTPKSLPKRVKLQSDVSSSDHQKLGTLPQKSQPKFVDPFFVTATNEEYVTTQVPVENSDNHKPKWSYRKDDYIPTKAKSFSNLKNNNRWNDRETSTQWSKNSDFGKNSFKKPFDNILEKTSTNERRPIGHLGNRKERRKALHQAVSSFQPDIKTEKLHPSWEAKKKISSIASFQGKKITFD